MSQSELDQQYLELSSSTLNQEKLDPHFLYTAIASEPDWKIIKKLLQVNFAEARDLEEASGLSRSAALNRADKLVEAGIVARQIKPGTENRHKPPYIFSLHSKARKLLRAMLKDQNAENELKTSKHQVFEVSAIEAFRNKQESEQLDSPEDAQKPEVTTNLGQDDSNNRVSQQLQQETLSALKEHNSSLEIVLTEMAKEIVALRNRVADLERKFEQNPQNPNEFDHNNILHMLKMKQNGKDTS